MTGMPPLEEALFSLMGGYENHEFQNMLEDNRPYIEEFSKSYPLLEIGVTMENGFFEPAYVFDDGIGLEYTIEGVRRSLEDSLYE